MMPVVSDLFTLKYGHSLELNRLDQSTAPDAINFVSRTARNNGVSAKIQRIPDLEPAAAGTITVALGGQGGAGEAFLQPFPYYCGRDVMILTPKAAMPTQELLWWATCITANRFRFGFGRQANKTLKSLALPASKAIPDWAISSNVDCFKGAAEAERSTATSLSNPLSWRAFNFEDLFDVRKGKRLTKANMISGAIPFIGAVEKNNGISDYVSESIHAGNTITVSYDGSIGEAYFQPNPFWASDAVNVLYPKFPLNAERAMFICTLIRQEKYRFNYGRKWHLGLMRKSTIKLPVSGNGAPDWVYMERFIKGLPFSSQLKP
jgi:hypothetical protein